MLLGCGGSGDAATEDPGSLNGDVQVHGALRAMFHEGQIGTQVTLDTLLPDPHLYAVGALSDLSGEITIVGGETYLSYPEGDQARTEAVSQPDAGASLLVSARVTAWTSVTTKHPIPFETLDEAIGELAAQAGMDLDRRIPFLLEGEFEDLRWHVVDGTRLPEGETTHVDHLAASVQTALDRATATLIGFYSTGDQGVFTHMGSTTHIHCILEEPLATGHVDHVVIPAGTTIKFPAGAGESGTESSGAGTE